MIEMHKSEAKTSVVLAFRWILCSGLGLGAGIALALSVADPIEKLVGMMLVTPIMLTAAGGIFASSQWLSFWRRDRIGWAWIGATSVALGISMTLGIVIVEVIGRTITGEPMRLFEATLVERTISLMVIGAVTGFGVGLSQWVVVRRYLQGSYWIWLTTVAFAIGFPCGALVSELLPGGLGSLLGFATFVCFTGFIAGAITASSALRIAGRLEGQI